MEAETFVTIHDQDLVLELERNGTFADLTSVRYLFVGRRPVDRIPPDVDLIVCRDFVPNVEQLPSFYDFTGWSVLARHGLIETDHAIFLQYDMSLRRADLEAVCVRKLSEQPGMIAFTAGHFGPNWILGVPGFGEAFRRGLAARGVDPSTFPPFHQWPSTQGTAWTTSVFVDFLEFFEPMFELWADEIFAGHLAERTVKAFLVSSGIPEQYLPNAIEHRAEDCHGTGALMAGKRAVYEARNAEFIHQSS